MGISTSTGTLTAGQSRTFNLAPASAVTLTLLPNARVTITESPAIVTATGLGGNATRVHEPRLPGTFTYGPYPMGGSVLVENESNSGSSVAWTETNALYAKDDDGNVTGLVGPDGNPFYQQPLAQSAIPFIMTSSGNFGSFGVLSAITAMNTTHKAAYCYFPANVINNISTPAGWYWTVFRSTTVADVYQERYLTGTPQIPATQTPFAGSGPGAWTQTTGLDIIGPNVVVPANSMGPNGSIVWERGITVLNSAGAKTLNTYFGSSVVQGASLTTTPYNGGIGTIKNRGIATKQYAVNGANGDVGNAGGVKYLAIDTTQDQVAAQAIKLAVATDYAVIESFSFKLCPKA